MKTSSLLLLLALSTALTLALPGREAHAAPVAVHSSVSAAAQSPSTNSSATNCKRKCLKELQRNLRENKRACWICSHSVLGICFAGHHDEACVERLRDLADDIHEGCVKDC